VGEGQAKTTLIGVDCAVQSKNVGIAIGTFHQDVVSIEDVCVGVDDPAQYITSIVRHRSPYILAIDSPLGWPIAMGQALNVHSASESLPIEANFLFRRETDRFVKREIGKQSLDVGADRIARTAHAAIALLENIRRLTNNAVPLAWNGEELGDMTCMEVYPAATLEAIGISSRGYKGNKESHRQMRAKLLDDLSATLNLPESTATLAIANDDALDAAICCVAAADFLRGLAFEPPDVDIARKEGWIWVRRPQEQ